MSFKYSCVGIAVVSVLWANNAAADTNISAASSVEVVQNIASNEASIERIQVIGQSFNDYKIGTASGAMRGDIDLMDTPQSVAIIPSFVTDEQLATNLAEVLVNDSSVTAGSTRWNRQVFSIRGFELSSGTGFLVNGHQQWSHYVQPIETLEQTEVLKGPSSMLYGQSGPGGLINMVTKKATHDSLLELGFDTDEHGSTRFQLDAGGSLNQEQTLRYRTVLVKQDAEYWREYANGENQERDRWLGYLNLEYDISDDVMLSMRYDHTQDKTSIDAGSWLDDQGNVIGKDEDIWDMAWAYTDIKVVNKGVDLTWAISDDWQLKTGYNDQEFNRNRFDSSPYYDADALTSGYKIRPFDRFDDWGHKTAYMDITGEFELAGIEHQLLVGGNYLKYNYGQLRERGGYIDVAYGQTIAKPALNYRDDETWYKSDYEYYGVYLQDLMTFNEQWQMLVGGRYDEQNKKGAGNNSYAFSPKFGVIYSSAENISIYANYSKSFTPKGSVNDKDDVNNGMNLTPEYGTQYELGAKWELYDAGLLLTGAVFDIEVDDKVISNNVDSDPSGNKTITTQGGKQRHKGIELGAQGQIAESWFATTSMMYLDAELDTHINSGKAPVDAPEWSANIWTRYEVNEALAVNLGAIYVGKRFANLENSIIKDSYVRFDLGAAYTINVMDTEVSVRANVKNLFDTDYLDGGDYKKVSVGEDRHFSLALSAKF